MLWEPSGKLYVYWFEAIWVNGEKESPALMACNGDSTDPLLLRSCMPGLCLLLNIQSRRHYHGRCSKVGLWHQPTATATPLEVCGQAGDEEIQYLIPTDLLLHCPVAQWRMADIQEDMDEITTTKLNPGPREITSVCQTRTEYAVALAGGQALLTSKELQYQSLFGLPRHGLWKRQASKPVNNPHQTAIINRAVVL